MSGNTSELSDQTWDKAKPPATMDRRRLEGTNIALLVLTSVVFLLRVGVRITRRKKFELHDLFCWASYICYVCMWVMYYRENDPLYRAEGVQRGEIPPYPEIIHDAGMIYRWMTAGQLLFYSSLTLVKLSLLFLYRRLLKQAPIKFTITWWGILAFCILSFIGASMTTIFVCDDQKAKYNQGICAKPNEQKRAQFSLWFAYAVDVASDLAVMFLPFRMTWSLQMPRSKKLGVFVLFGGGWVCILFGTLRVVQVGTMDGVPKVPDPKWLQMWTVIETSMAVIIGCAPAFAAVIHKQFGSLAISYDSRGEAKQPAQEVQTPRVGSVSGSANGSKSGSSDRANGREDLWRTESNASDDALAEEPPVMVFKGTRIRR